MNKQHHVFYHMMLSSEMRVTPHGIFLGSSLSIAPHKPKTGKHLTFHIYTTLSLYPRMKIILNENM